MTRSVFAQSDITNVRSAIRDLRPFRTSGNLSGIQGPAYSSGQNYGSAKTALRADIEKGDILYTLLSYSTPIAWLTSSGWRYVARSFSNSTSKAQSTIRQAIRNNTPICVLQASTGLTSAQTALVEAIGSSPSSYIIMPREKQTARVLLARNIINAQGDLTSTGRTVLACIRDEIPAFSN